MEIVNYLFDLHLNKQISFGSQECVSDVFFPFFKNLPVNYIRITLIAKSGFIRRVPVL